MISMLVHDGQIVIFRMILTNIEMMGQNPPTLILRRMFLLLHRSMGKWVFQNLLMGWIWCVKIIHVNLPLGFLDVMNLLFLQGDMILVSMCAGKKLREVVALFKWEIMGIVGYCSWTGIYIYAYIYILYIHKLYILHSTIWHLCALKIWVSHPQDGGFYERGNHDQPVDFGVVQHHHFWPIHMTSVGLG